MEFFIRKGSTDPILKLKLIDDGKNDKSSFNDLLVNSVITFEMFDVSTGVFEILNSPCYLTTKIQKYNNTTDEFYIVHRFTIEQTSIVGRYEGKITITFEDNNVLIVPIKEKLFINII